MTLPPDTDRASVTSEARLRIKRKSHKGRNVLIGITAALLVAVLVAGGYLLNLAHTFNSNSGKIARAFPEESSRPGEAEAATGAAPLSILIMGSDSRSDGEVDIAVDTATDQRADTLMLLHIPADRASIYTVSILRDLWVDIPGHGQSKINSALTYGGVPLMVQTIESLFSRRIDHVAIVDFEGFKGLTDALGGVEVTSGVSFTTSNYDAYSYKVGPNLLRGDEALGFVRERYAFPDGDYQRVRNQQAFLKALIDESISAETLSNPVTVYNIVTSFSPFVSVDKSLDAATLARLGFELRNIREQDVVMFTLPTNGTGTSDDGQSIVLPNPEAMTKIADALANDSLGAYVEANNF